MQSTPEAGQLCDMLRVYAQGYGTYLKPYTRCNQELFAVFRIKIFAYHLNFITTVSLFTSGTRDEISGFAVSNLGSNDGILVIGTKDRRRHAHYL